MLLSGACAHSANLRPAGRFEVSRKKRQMHSIYRKRYLERESAEKDRIRKKTDFDPYQRLSPEGIEEIRSSQRQKTDMLAEAHRERAKRFQQVYILWAEPK